MSDQTAHGNSPEWDVDWSAARTWWKFVGLSLLVATMLVAGNMIVFGAARLAISSMPETWLGGAFSPGDPEAGLPMAIVAAVLPVYLLGLVFVIKRWAGRAAGQAVSDGFPIALRLDDRRGFYSWFIFILVLYGAVFAGLSYVPAGPFSITADNWKIFFIALVVLLYSAKDIQSLFWRYLAERRTVESWESVRDKWSGWPPGFVIELLTAVSAIALLLTFVMLRA